MLNGEESVLIKYKTDRDVASTVQDRVRSSQETDKVLLLRSELAATFNVAPDRLSSALSWVSADIHDPQVQTNPDVLMTLMRGVERIAAFSQLKFKDEAIAYATDRAALLGISDRTSLTLDNLAALTSYQKTVALNPEAEQKLRATLDSYQTAASFSEADLTGLADLWRDVSLIRSLTTSLALSATAIEALRYLADVLAVCQRLGITGTPCKSWQAISISCRRAHWPARLPLVTWRLARSVPGMTTKEFEERNSSPSRIRSTF